MYRIGALEEVLLDLQVEEPIKLGLVQHLPTNVQHEDNGTPYKDNRRINGHLYDEIIKMQTKTNFQISLALDHLYRGKFAMQVQLAIHLQTL